MDFETYQRKYVSVLKSLLSTKLLGIFSKEVFEDFPRNLPRELKNDIISFLGDYFDESKTIDYEEEEYRNPLIHYWFLHKYKYDFIQLMALGKDEDFMNENPNVMDVFSDDFIEQEESIRKLSINEYEDLLTSESNDPRVKQLSKNLSSRFFGKIKFIQWLNYQEIIISMSVLESFLRYSYFYHQLLTNKNQNISLETANKGKTITFLINYFLKKDLGIVQRFGPSKKSAILLAKDLRNLIVHHDGIITKNFIKKYPQKDYKIDEMIALDASYFKEHYKIIGDLLRLIFKKNRFDANKLTKY